MSSLSPDNRLPEPLTGFVGEMGGAHPTGQGIFRASKQRFNSDFVLSMLVRGSAMSVLLMLGVLIFILFQNSRASMREFGFSFLTRSEWRPNATTQSKRDATGKILTRHDPYTDTDEPVGVDVIPPTFGALPMIYGTAVSSALALAIAVPLSFGAALFLVRIGAWLSPSFVKSGFTGLLITAVLIAISRSAIVAVLAACAGLAVAGALVWIAWRVEDPRVGPRRELELSLYAVIAVAVLVLSLGVLQTSWAAAVLAAIMAPLGLHYMAASFVGIVSFLIEFLAAIPSIAYGIWGVLVLSQFLGDRVEPSLNSFFAKMPFLRFLHTETNPNGHDMLCAASLLAIMILPIITAISRDVLRAVPRIQIEGTQALGATWWQSSWAMLRYGRSGLFGAVMLGLARAAGETMAVVMVMSPEPRISSSVLEPVGTMSSLIASQFKDATDMQRSALTEIALILLLMSLAFNIVARYLVVGTKSRAPAN
jgi:ABC-type phosphate transport system permease subunit